MKKDKNIIQIEEKNKIPPLFVYALGGLGEVGKNMYVFEQGTEIWIVDSGIKFASETISVEGIIPSFEYLEKNKKRIKGLIITHGHEDHIGSVPHLLNSVDIPNIYAGKIAAGLIWNKVRERGIKRPKINIINNKYSIKTLNFEIEFFNVNHSIPDCYGVVFKSKHGVVVTTGDFKFDFTPVGARADLNKMAALGQKGVDLMLSDSTNAGVEKFSNSEMDVREALDDLFSTSTGRIVVATFASNVYRVREIVSSAVKNKKKVVINGYSMDKVVDIARRIKYINAPDDIFMDLKEFKKYSGDDVVIISTGTQGELNAGISKMANGKHKEIKLKHNDTVIFASSAIPGNYEAVEKISNKLVKIGVNVIDNKKVPKIHASGHGGKQEQLLMFNLIRPRYFFPVHGETAMQVRHGQTAIKTGVNQKNVFILSNGQRLKMENGEVRKWDSVPAEDIYVDDTNLKGQSNKIIANRDKMSQNGIVTITVAIDSQKNEIILEPKIEIIGVFHKSSNKDVLEKIKQEVKKDLQNYWSSDDKITFKGLKEVIRTTGERVIFDTRKLSPIIVSIVLNYSQEIMNNFIKERNKEKNKEE
ncbi:MAG: ribonuclease J [Candidatus Tyloplasma litorale]|nr:MAG: ribonuclease J [Mycoplasmatales bacterium]